MKMKVVHCSNSISNSSAVTRLHRALLKRGDDSQILTLHNNDCIEQTKEFSASALKEKYHHYNEAIENYLMRKRYDIPADIPFCFGRVGYDITADEWIKEADIIHLHWVSGNFLSIKAIHKLLMLNKPVVWTLHDSWTLTGGCHVKLGCEYYKEMCGTCPVLNSTKKRDRTYYVMENKKQLLRNPNLTLIAPSNWMLNNIKNSLIFSQVNAYRIPNTLDTSVFREYTQNEIERALNYKRDNKIHILFGAVDSTTTSYKGFKYLKETLGILYREYPQTACRMVLHVFGAEEIKDGCLEQFEIKCWGMIRDARTLAYIYNLADAYVFPSVDDNLPSTVMESLACATPVACFRTGGVPDMVQHKFNGYIAIQRDVRDLLHGIMWILENNYDNILGKNGLTYVKKHYAEDIIARAHEELYDKVCV